MFHSFKYAVSIALVAGLGIACSPTEFSGQKVDQPSNALSSKNPDVPGLDDRVDVPPNQPAPDPGAGGLLCNYPLYNGPYNSPARSECHSRAYSSAPAAGTSVDTGQTIRFRMYNASNLSHGLVPSSHRFLATQKISLAPGLAAASVDLVLSSYEPVIWQMIGNTAAVRSVHVDGYHCAKVEGVDASRVRIQTYEQGVIEPSSPLPLSRIIALDQSFYEGSCLADNTLVIR